MMFGVFKKRVAISDTLLNQASPDEISAVLAHEIGHSKHWDILKMFAIGQISFTLLLMSFKRVMNSDGTFIAFGFSDKPVLIGLLITTLLITPFTKILSLPENLYSRHMENEADAFAAKLGYPLDQALIKLSKENKSAVEPDWLYIAFNDDHPSTVERVNSIRELVKKNQ